MCVMVCACVIVCVLACVTFHLSRATYAQQLVVQPVLVGGRQQVCTIRVVVRRHDRLWGQDASERGSGRKGKRDVSPMGAFLVAARPTAEFRCRCFPLAPSPSFNSAEARERLTAGPRAGARWPAAMARASTRTTTAQQAKRFEAGTLSSRRDQNLVPCGKATTSASLPNAGASSAKQHKAHNSRMVILGRKSS